MQIKNKSRKLYIALFVVALVAFCSFSETLSLGQKIYEAAPKIFIWNDTYSVPKGLYLIVPMGEIERGDYVLFEGTESIRNLAIKREWIKEHTLFLKKVGALYGDTFTVDPKTNMFYVNNLYIGMVSEKDSQGRELPRRIHGREIVKPDYFLPVGDSPRSFDGRYFGAQPISTIKHKVIPIFTFTN